MMTTRALRLACAGLLLAAATVSGQSSFKARVAALDARAKAMASATDAEARGAATLAWLQALRRVLEFDRPGAAEKRWLNDNAKLVFYNEPGGVWMIRDTEIWRAHEGVKGTAAADEIAWLAVGNGLGGECEGYVPCYAHRLNRLEGEYLRRHPRGRYAGEVFRQIDEHLGHIANLLARKDAANGFMKVPDDCADLLKETKPLRAAVAAAQHARTPDTLRVLDRLIGVCPPSR